MVFKILSHLLSKKKISDDSKSLLLNKQTHLSPEITINIEVSNTNNEYDYCTICDILVTSHCKLKHCTLCNCCHIGNKINCSYCKQCYDFRIDSDIIKHRKLCNVYNKLSCSN